MKKCGYSFWGYLGDVKFTPDGNIASTPDGNAFYSWCIIRELQKRGYEVTQIMPDRDAIGYRVMGRSLFEAFAETDRVMAYRDTEKLKYILLDAMRYSMISIGDIISKVKRYVMKILESKCKDMEFILHEYRMLIPGRNDINSIRSTKWQPDFLIQECLFEYCCKKHKRLILFDLDYKLDYKTYFDLKSNGCNVVVFELGIKWRKYANINNGVEFRQVYIPFDFGHIHDMPIKPISERKNSLVYVGNRYERDWCIDKYIPEDINECVVYGNWLEGNRDSHERWPNIRFGTRLQTRDIKDVYANSIATVLLAKKEYCEYGFMTARILESVFYGTVPLFIEEYGENTIEKFAGLFSKVITVFNKEDVKFMIYKLITKDDGEWEKCIIEYLRKYLSFMDVRYFVDAIEEVK